MKNKIPFLLLCIVVCLVISNLGCLKYEKELIREEFEDTTIYSFTRLGLLIDAGTLNGLPNAQVEIHGVTKTNSDTIFASTITDSTGYFKLKYSIRGHQSILNLQFSHSNPVFNKRIYNSSDEKINDSTELFYLHRKPLCFIKIKNPTGKTGNYLLFNKLQNFNKVLMNLKKDTAFSFLMPDYNDIIYFDNFPQKALQSQNLLGGTSGDTVAVTFTIP